MKPVNWRALRRARRALKRAQSRDVREWKRNGDYDVRWRRWSWWRLSDGKRLHGRDFARAVSDEIGRIESMTFVAPFSSVIRS